MSIVDQVARQGHDLVQMNTRRELTDMSLRVRSLQEQNDALRSQVSHQVQQTHEQPATKAVTFTPIAVNTLTTNYPVSELLKRINMSMKIVILRKTKIN